jgi:hypothetical protein
LELSPCRKKWRSTAGRSSRPRPGPPSTTKLLGAGALAARRSAALGDCLAAAVLEDMGFPAKNLRMQVDAGVRRLASSAPR